MEYIWLVTSSTETRLKSNSYTSPHDVFPSQEMALIWLESQGCSIDRFDHKTEIPVDIKFGFINKKEKTFFYLTKLKVIDEF